MTPERLAGIKARYLNRSLLPDPAFTDMHLLIADNERLRAELHERCLYLRDLQDVETDPDDQAETCYCPSCRVAWAGETADHAPDCRHARLMKMPEASA